MIALLLAVLSSLSQLEFFHQPETLPHARDQAVQTRGDHVMGFSHNKTAHDFLLYADGGAIVVSANDGNYKQTIEQIRVHLSHISQMFADGNFQAPFLIHDTNPRGTASTTKRKGEIRYVYSETSQGASVRIFTGDSSATDAVHAFLLFRIVNHRTGNSPATSAALPAH